MLVSLAKACVIFLLMVQLVPLLVWVERRGSAFIQGRFGPNRVGPLGLVQLLADAVKFLFKQEFAPPQGLSWLFYAAPVVALVPGALAFASIPLSAPFYIEAFDWLGHSFGPYLIEPQSFKLGVGVVFVLGVSSLGAYALLMAGWSSHNKYSLLGALRASAQMVSYELALGLSLVGALIIYGSFHFDDIIQAQQGPLAFAMWGNALSLPLPNWGIFYQPLGFVLLFVALFAECNRTPFDLPEAEAELVAGYHTEYGGLKMLMFYIGEYGHMLVASALVVVVYFGGYDPGHWFGWELSAKDISAWWQSAWGLGFNLSQVLMALVLHGVFMLKVLVFLWVFIWVRWTIPRFRYDQLMNLGWRTMLPWALGNTAVTAVWVYAVY